MDFDAYIIRITDADGDDVKTVPNNYGTAHTFYTYTGGAATDRKMADRKLFIADLTAGGPTAAPPHVP